MTFNAIDIDKNGNVIADLSKAVLPDDLKQLIAEIWTNGKKMIA